MQGAGRWRGVFEGGERTIVGIPELVACCVDVLFEFLVDDLFELDHIVGRRIP